MSSDAEKLRRDGWIDVFRGLAAVSVVLFHFSVIPFNGDPGPGTSAWRAFWSRGYLGVPVFFSVSGYCIGRTWLKAAGWRDFALRRFRRIFPPYWASLIVLVAFACARKLVNGVNDVAVLPRSVPAVAATLALATSPMSTVKTMNWVYWTLTCEVAFYAVLTLILVCRKARIRILAWTHVVFCVVAAAGFNPSVGPLFIVNHWPLFGTGAALALIAEHRSPALLMFGASAFYTLFGSHHQPGLDFVVISAATVVLIWLTRSAIFPVFLSPFRELGLFSYSLYLVHVPLGVYGLMRFLPKRFPSDPCYIGEELILLVGTILIARLFYLVAERPFVHLPPKP
jgi:peptidoglycan/LPS O-acetylase OafA/YrhL